MIAAVLLVALSQVISGLVLLGVVRRQSRLRREIHALKAGPPEPQPVCGCKHHYAYHDPETGRCHVMVPESMFAGGFRTVTGERQCPCRRYAGPEPLPQAYAA